MSGRVAGHRDDTDARRDLGPVLDERPVLPGREDVCDPLRGGAAPFGKLLDAARVGPPVVFDRVHDELGVREDRRVGAPLHEAPDVIGVEMRDEDRADLRVVDPGRLHVGRQIGRVGLPLPDARAGVAHDQPVPDLQDEDGQRDRHEGGRQAGPRERLLGLFDRRVPDEVRIVGLAPDAVVDGRHFDRADIEPVEPGAGLQRRGRGRADNPQRLLEPESCRGGRRHHKSSARKIEHGLLLCGSRDRRTGSRRW